MPELTERELIIQDFMHICSYSKREAEIAANNVIDFESREM